MTRNFPTIPEVLAIHDDQIALFGGTLAIRDMGALESADMRPQLGYYNGIIEEAAALLKTFAMKHPFGGRNKRTVSGAIEAFLRLNGSYIEYDGREAYDFSCTCSRPIISGSPNCVPSLNSMSNP